MEIPVTRAMLDRLAQRGYTDKQIESMWAEDVVHLYTNDISPERSAQLAKFTGEKVLRYHDGPVDDLERLDDAFAAAKPKDEEPPDTWFMRFRMAWTDRMAPLEWLGKQVGSEVYEMGRLVPGAAMRGESLVEQHVLPIIKDFTPEELEDLEKYMTAWRMIDLRLLDPTYKLPAAIDEPKHALAQLIKRIGGVDGMQHPAMRKIGIAAHYLWEVNQQVLLSRARDGGRLNNEQVQVLIQKHPHYLPFYREGVPSDLDILGGYGGDQVANLSENFLRHLSATGSEKKLDHPLARWMTMLVKNEVDIARNTTAKEMVANLETYQDALGEQLVFRGDVPQEDSAKVEWFEDGEHQVAWIPTIFARAAKALDKEAANIITSMFSPMAQVLRLGTTQLNLPFTVVNTMRDAMTAWFNEGLHPFGEAYWQGWAAALTHNDTWHEAARAGALGAGMGDAFRNLQDIDRRNRQLAIGISVRNWEEAAQIAPKTIDLFKRMGDEVTAMAEAKRTGNTQFGSDMAAKFMEDVRLAMLAGPRMIMSLNDVAETATRVAGYQHLKNKKGLKGRELAVRAREITIDFAKAGTALQMINRVVPFTNAQTQAAIKTWQVDQAQPRAGPAGGDPVCGGQPAGLSAQQTLRDVRGDPGL